MKEEKQRIQAKLEVLEENFKGELLQLGCVGEQDEANDCDKEEEVVICEEDCVAEVLPEEEELGATELAQVEPDSCTMLPLKEGGTHMERPHKNVSTTITCVSLELLEDGPYA